MHQTELPPPAPYRHQQQQQQQQQPPQLQELERTMKSLSVAAAAADRHRQQQRREDADSKEDGGTASPSYENNHNDSIDASEAEAMPTTAEATTPNNKGSHKRKKCLHLNLISISSCHNPASPFERIANGGNGVLSPWQQQQQPSCQPRRFHRHTKLFPVHILPCLFLGNDETAKNRDTLEKSGIRYIINVTSDLPNYFEGEGQFTYMRIPVDDNSSHNLGQFFPDAISLIEKARLEHAAVLVHCWAGISRSVTVCLAYLMYALQCTLEEAFDRLLKQNGTISPNFHFMEALTCWERKLLSCNFSHSAMGIDLPKNGIVNNGFHLHHHSHQKKEEDMLDIPMSAAANAHPTVSPPTAFNAAALVHPATAVPY